MKLNGSVLVAVAMMLGSIGAIGCKGTDNNAQPELGVTEAPAAEPAKTETASTTGTKTDESFNVQAKTSVRIGEDRQPRFVPMAPPPVRYERPGRAPSARHFWVNGYHKYVNGRYIWVGGHWDVKRSGRTFVQPHYDRVDGRTRYVPGHWA